MKRKHYVELNRQEWRLALNGLNRFRNKLIAAGRYTDAVDEIKIAAATVLNRPLSSRQVKKEKLRHEGLVPVSKGSQAL